MNAVVVAVIINGCVGAGAVEQAALPAATPTPEFMSLFIAGTGAVSFTLRWVGDLTIERDILYPTDTAPYASGDFFMAFDDQGAGWSALGANGGQGVALSSEASGKLAARPFHQPFPNLTQHSSTRLKAPDGPVTRGFALIAASGNESVPFLLWINGSSFDILDGPHQGSARALAFDAWSGSAGMKTRLVGSGGTALVDSRLTWSTSRGTVAFYYRSLEGIDSATYERSRLSNANQSWGTEFAAILGDTVSLDSQRTLPHGHFILVSDEKGWEYSVAQRAAIDSPIELLLIGDVEPPRGFAEPGTSLILPPMQG